MKQLKRCTLTRAASPGRSETACQQVFTSRRAAAFSPISFCHLDSLFRARDEVPPNVPWSTDGRTADEGEAHVGFSLQHGSALRREDEHAACFGSLGIAGDGALDKSSSLTGS